MAFTEWTILAEVSDYVDLVQNGQNNVACLIVPLSCIHFILFFYVLWKAVGSCKDYAKSAIDPKLGLLIGKKEKKMNKGKSAKQGRRKSP